MIEIKISQEDAKHMENFIEEHMEYCVQELSGVDPEENPEEYPEGWVSHDIDSHIEIPESWSTYGPYCGCTTCDSREYIMAMLDWLRRNKILDLYIED